MATNVTLIKNTLLNKYFVHHGGSVAVHEFPTQNAGEFSVVGLASDPGLVYTPDKGEKRRLHVYLCIK